MVVAVVIGTCYHRERHVMERLPHCNCAVGIADAAAAAAPGCGIGDRSCLFTTSSLLQDSHTALPTAWSIGWLGVLGVPAGPCAECIEISAVQSHDVPAAVRSCAPSVIEAFLVRVGLCVRTARRLVRLEGAGCWALPQYCVHHRGVF